MPSGMVLAAVPLAAPFATLLILGLAAVIRPPAATGLADVISAFFGNRRDRSDSEADGQE